MAISPKGYIFDSVCQAKIHLRGERFFQFSIACYMSFNWEKFVEKMKKQNKGEKYRLMFNCHRRIYGNEDDNKTSRFYCANDSSHYCLFV